MICMWNVVLFRTGELETFVLLQSVEEADVVCDRLHWPPSQSHISRTSNKQLRYKEVREQGSDTCLSAAFLEWVVLLLLLPPRPPSSINIRFQLLRSSHMDWTPGTLQRVCRFSEWTKPSVVDGDCWCIHLHELGFSASLACMAIDGLASFYSIYVLIDSVSLKNLA